MNKKVIFFGNWGRGEKVLGSICEKVDIIAVFTQFERDSQDKYFNYVYNFAKKKAMNIYNVAEKNSSEFNEVLLDFLNNSEYTSEQMLGVSVAFNKIFKPLVLDRLRIVNLHTSLLPKYRGPSPELWAIKNNEKCLGLTLHLIDEGIDTGDILEQTQIQINYDWTSAEFIDIVNLACAEFMAESLGEIESLLNKKTPQKQKELYCKRIKLKGDLDNKTLSEIRKLLNHEQRMD